MPDNSNNFDIMHVTNLAAGNVDISGDVKVADDRSISKLEELIRRVQHIDDSVARMVASGRMPSQTDAQGWTNDSRRGGRFGQEYDERYGTGGRASRRRSGYGSTSSGFLDSFEDAIWDGVLGSDFKNKVKDIFSDFADQLGTDVAHIPDEFGKRLGENVMKSLRESQFGQQIFGRFDTIKNNAADYLRNKGQSVINNLNNPSGRGAQSIDDFVSRFQNVRGWSGIRDFASSSVRDSASFIRNVGSGIKNAASSIFGNAGSAAASGAAEAAGAASAASGAAGAAGAAGATVGAEAAGAAMTSTVAAEAGTALTGLSTAASGAAAATTAAGAAFPPLAVAIVAAIVVVKAFSAITSALSDAFEGLQIMIKALSKAANRDQKSRERNVELAYQRMHADIETMVREPFKILEQAAQAWYDTWDSQLKTINATQGYTKSDLQDLMTAFTERLRDEGMTEYISGSDITNNLAKVLESGLSGKIAEEFAYQATKLNAAVPTQDFFNYASTYASVAANAVRAGQSQTEAIETANKSLEDFTNGLLFASRELSGGFTTGLQDAASIYEQAVKISQASKTGNISDIAGVLLAVRGEVGAVAPDLASSITDTIYKMLTGGNSSDTVALRSLAGVNASNTEFLRAVAENPKKVFSTLFNNLALMYSDSNDAYMEKAEGYSTLFGLSAEAFQRINFTDLAAAISKMNMSGSSLDENMKLLAEGQTTTTAEQLKNQQINQYMIEQGLSLVLDNAAARSIQEHMWQEQIERELMEATYAVELKGSAAEALEKLKSAVNNILNFLNPFAWFKKIGNVVATSVEAAAQDADIHQLLELGKVGSGNTTEMYQLTTRNKNLNLVDDLITMMGGVSAYGVASQGTKIWEGLTNPVFALGYGGESLFGYLKAALHPGGTPSTSGPTSQYSWGSVGKSQAGLAAKLLGRSAEVATPLQSVVTKSGTSAASASAATVKSQLDKMLADDYLVEKFVNQGKSYNEWAATASNFNISDLSKAIEDAGYSEADIEQYFQDKETEKGMEAANDIKMEEKLFRDTGIAFWTEQFPTEYRDPLFELLQTNNEQLKDIYDEQVAWRGYYKSEWINKGWAAYVSAGSGSNGLFNKFYNEFMKYFVNHYYYSNTSGYTYSDVETIQRKSKEQENGDTVYALAEMLTKNLVDLKDPTMQTNALLGQILIVVNAIMNQQNEVAGTTGQGQLLESLSAMALGMTARPSGTT